MAGYIIPNPGQMYTWRPHSERTSDFDELASGGDPVRTRRHRHRELRHDPFPPPEVHRSVQPEVVQFDRREVHVHGHPLPRLSQPLGECLVVFFPETAGSKVFGSNKHRITLCYWLKYTMAKELFLIGNTDVNLVVALITNGIRFDYSGHFIGPEGIR